MQSDDNGNVYFYAGVDNTSETIIKLDPLRNKLSTILECGQATNEYTVMPNGTLLYGTRALTTGGSIVDLGSKPFILNDEIYSTPADELEVTAEAENGLQFISLIAL